MDNREALNHKRKRRAAGWFAVGVLIAALVAGLPVVRARQNLPQIPYPADDAGVQSLANRTREQQAKAEQFQVPHDFHFTDRASESGITFVHRIVDDAGLSYKAVHYDHGNGLAIADVDGDGLYDIYFLNQAGPNELWKNLGGGKFKNITAEAGVGVSGRISVGASFADIDNDGDPDLYVTTVRGGNLLFENDGHGHFRDITRTANLQHVAHSSGSTFFDYNNDGLLDLLVCDVGTYTGNTRGAQGQYVGLPDAFSGHMYPERFEHPVLYENLGQRKFRDVTAAVHLNPTGWCGDAAFADLNEDGWPDVYFLNMMGSNHYFENQQGKRFVEKTPQYFPRTPWGAMGIKFFDFDNDGRMDLLVTDMHSDMFGELAPAEEKKKALTHPADSFLMGTPDHFIFGNALYHNLGGGKFEEVSDEQGVENYWPWGPSVGDLNADGWDDIFIASSMNFPFRYGINSLLLNDHGRRFVDAEFVLGIEPRKDNRTHAPWFELDCAHLPADPRGLMHQICEGRTDRITVMAPLGSRSSAIFDLDQDGDLDIVTNEFNSAPQILVSDLASRRAIHWLSIKLEGTSSNRDGLGATVRVATPTRTYMKYNDGKSGYLSQSSLPLWFGLGEDTSVNRIEINWPSGSRQVVTQDLGINRLLHLKEPAR